MSLGWWCLSGEDLLAMLREVADGGDPDLVYAEHHANAQHQRPDDVGADPGITRS